MEFKKINETFESRDLKHVMWKVRINEFSGIGKTHFLKRAKKESKAKLFFLVVGFFFPVL